MLLSIKMTVHFSLMREWNTGGVNIRVKCNLLLGAVVAVMEIGCAIYIKVFSDGNVSYFTVCTGDVLNTTHN